MSTRLYQPTSKVPLKPVAVPEPKFAPTTSLPQINEDWEEPKISIPISPSANRFTNTANSSTAASPAEVAMAYNVYARPFVPSFLVHINREVAAVVHTQTRQEINYPTYISTFAGASFLPEQHSARARPFGIQAVSVENVSENSYFNDLASFWRVEMQAKEQENENFALYHVRLQRVRFRNGPRDLFALSVPGIREDSPLVEMGDTLHLRQLCVDRIGNVVDMPGRTGDPHPHHNWMGTQYNASVYSVNRTSETVYLRAEGLSELCMGQTILPIYVNVIFPLKKRVTDACRVALVSVDYALKQANASRQRTDETADAHDKLCQQVASIALSNRPLHQANGAPTNGISSLAQSSHTDSPKNDWIRRILFSLENDGQVQTKLRNVPHRELFDHELNYEQAHAVNSVCTKDYGTIPYLISGPPGTGKTKTLVEAAMQLLHSTKTDHILICAPSDPAADTLALRLKQYLNPSQLLRLNGPWRADIEVPRELMQYCYLQDDMFYLPAFRKLMAYNVVVTSCRDAAILAEARLTNNDLWSVEKNMFTAFHPEDKGPSPALHWGALVIDEAAQATELDSLPAISVVCPPSDYPQEMPQPLLVMAGDENQLGPRTASRDPRYSTSLFARLFDRSVYKSHPLSRSNIKPSTSPPVLKKSMLPILYPPFTNLIRNYRSHPAILSVPSMLFYNDTLLPEAPIPNTPLQHSPLWQGRKWPVLYITNPGNDEIERDGGGWYNIAEARIACNIAQRFVYESGVIQSDICIMSPFAAQVKLLRSMIRSNAYGGGSGLWDVNIGPLEAFQGLEKRVVIICTTRTRQRFLQEDAKRGLGIIHQPRKMNVALTRAKEGLAVIGNPDVLQTDQHWKEWLAFCWRNGLFWDETRMWRRDEVACTGGRLGVLERALLAKEEKQNGRGTGRVLGGAAVDLHMGVQGDYDSWVQSLKEALEEEEQQDVEAEDEDEGGLEPEEGV